MGTLELLLIAIGLSMDAFAVAICHGLSMKKVTFKKALIVGLYFGLFQAGMPLIGYLVGYRFSNIVESFDHWIAFVLLAFLGIKMIRDSFQKEGCSDRECPPGNCPDRACPNGVKPTLQEAALDLKTMLPLALATSIDALAVGVSFAFMKVHIAPAVAFIGAITLALSMIGVKIGNVFGTRFKSKAEFIGGLILVLMGLKILLQHLGFIA